MDNSEHDRGQPPTILRTMATILFPRPGRRRPALHGSAMARHPKIRTLATLLGSKRVIRRKDESEKGSGGHYPRLCDLVLSSRQRKFRSDSETPTKDPKVPGHQTPSARSRSGAMSPGDVSRRHQFPRTPAQRDSPQQPHHFISVLAARLPLCQMRPPTDFLTHGKLSYGCSA